MAVLATLSASRSATLIGAGEPTSAALTSGYHLAFGIGAVLVLVAIAVAVTVLQPERDTEPKAEPEAEPEADVDPAECEAA